MPVKAQKEPEGTKKLGVRELSKQQTQAKIIKVARQLFAEQGYDGATMRQIATRAGLGLGTLSNYVTVKRDLIYLIFNEEVDALTGRALAAPKPSQSFIKQMLSITEPHYRMFEAEPILSRILLSEILQHTPGLHLERYLRIRDRLIRGVEEFVVAAQQKGEIRSTESSDVIALNIFFIFSASARWFLDTAKPDWRKGQELAERMISLLMNGMSHPLEGNQTAGSPRPKGGTSRIHWTS